jgi:hypothetical protein
MPPVAPNARGIPNCRESSAITTALSTLAPPVTCPDHRVGIDTLDNIEKHQRVMLPVFEERSKQSQAGPLAFAITNLQPPEPTSAAPTGLLLQVGEQPKRQRG